MLQSSVESARRKLEIGELGEHAQKTNQTLTESLLDDLAVAYRTFFKKQFLKEKSGLSNEKINELLKPYPDPEELTPTVRFGLKRTGSLVTPIDNTDRYLQALEASLDFLGEENKAFYPHRDTVDMFDPRYLALMQGKGNELEFSGQKIKLTHISMLDNRLTWFHTPVQNIVPVLQSVDEILRATLALQSQQRTPAVQQQIIDNIARMHYRLAHATPYERGSAGITDAFTKVLFDHVGIEVPPWKAGIAPDLKAFTMSEEDFVAQYGTFFERPLTTGVSESGSGAVR